MIAASLDFEFVTFVPKRPQPTDGGLLELEEAGAGSMGGAPEPNKCSTPLPPLPPDTVPPDGMGVYLPGPAPRRSPFAAAAEVEHSAEGAAAVAVKEATPASQALLEVGLLGSWQRCGGGW